MNNYKPGYYWVRDEDGKTVSVRTDDVGYWYLSDDKMAYQLTELKEMGYIIKGAITPGEKAGAAESPENNPEATYRGMPFEPPYGDVHCTWDDPVWYGEWRIYENDFTAHHDWRKVAYVYCHKEYDGDEDNRCGHAASIEACIAEIEEFEGERI